MTISAERLHAPSGAALVTRIGMRVDVDRESGCWNWTGALDHQGYGRLKVDGRAARVHRVAWEQFFLSIPAGLTLDHLCRNRACCNPVHLEPVTSRVNIQRAWEHRPQPISPTTLGPVLAEPCATWTYLLRHLSAGLVEPHFNGRRGRALCGAIAFTEDVVRRRRGPIGDLPPCKLCARRGVAS